MSQGPENRFIASIHRLISENKPYHLKNNNMYTGGIFDCWYSGNKADLWVEYKYGKNTLSALQLEWGKARYTEGRYVVVIVGDKTGGVIYKNPSSWETLVGGTHMTKAELARWLVDQTMRKITNAEKVVQRRKRHGKRI